MIDVLIADDHPIIRLGLSHIINEQRDMRVVAKAKNGMEAIEKAISLKPDVAILDTHMPTLNGLTAAEKILERIRSSKVIMLLSNSDKELLLQSVRLGALGVLSKKDSELDLIEAIRIVSKGSAYLKPEQIKVLFDQCKGNEFPS